MKRLLIPLALIGGMAALFVFVLPPIQRFFGLSDSAVHWLVGLIGMPLAWIVLYGVPSMGWLKGASKVQIGYRLLGVAVALVGAVLAFGNRSGLLVTFPFAGTLLILAGVAIFYFLGKPGDVSHGDQQTKR